MQNNQIFGYFLDTHGATTAYIENCYKEGMKEIQEPRDLIISAFSWGRTEEGFNYWYNLHREWLRLIGEIE